MNYYLSKYVGKYRVIAEIDRSTNDFCRDEYGNLENDQDIWIKCASNIKVFYHGKGYLEIYIPSLGKGRNIIKTIYQRYINSANTQTNQVLTTTKNGKEYIKENIEILNNALFSKDLETTEFVKNYTETDEEVTFLIKDKNFNNIVDIIKPLTNGAGISPFSTKNLPKCKTVLTNDQMKEYRKITDTIPKEDKLKVSYINNRFMSDILCKKLGLNMKTDVKPEMKKKCMKALDYISYKGVWNEYIVFLENEIKNL